MNPRSRPHCHGCGRFWAHNHVCQTRLRLRPPTEALEPALRLVKTYGSIKRAGIAYSERHGLARKSGERLLHRIIHGHVQRVQANTVDRLEVLV